MLSFRLRPPPRTFLSRSYNSTSPSNKPILARPYLWWLKARYRKDGTRRSILKGIYFGACYAAVLYIAYRQYPRIKAKEHSNVKLSVVVKLQHMHHKYRTSSFTEPAEVKAYLTGLAEFGTDPLGSRLLLAFCKEYDDMPENVPEIRENIRKRICEFRDLLLKDTDTFMEFRLQEVESILVKGFEVEIAYHNLRLEIFESLTSHFEKKAEKLEKGIQEASSLMKRP